MKKIICVFLLLVLAFNLISCGEKEETRDYEKTADKIIEKMEKGKDISKFKDEINKIEAEVIEKVENSADEENGQYDMQQISVFLLKEAMESYENAKTDEERQNALKDIEFAKEIWSGKNE